MIRFRNYSSLVLVASLLAACSGSGNSASPTPNPERPPHVDDDERDDDDNHDTEDDDNGDGDVTEADSDHDGLTNDRDLCPGTGDAEVDGNGCSKDQRDAENGDNGSSDPQDPDTNDRDDDNTITDEEIEDWTPADDGKSAANGFATFVLDPQGKNPIVLKTLASSVETLENGFRVEGTLLVDAPGDEQIPLFEASLVLEYDAEAGAGLQRVRGDVRLPFPGGGVFDDASIDDIVKASIGYDLGENIDAEGPFADDRKYLFFTFTAGFTGHVNELEVSSSVGQSVTMALDPNDPAFFLHASLGGLLGPINDAGVGFSAGGYLQFEPANTWGIEAKADGFQGHLWIAGTVDLNTFKLPLAVSGETVYDFDPNDDGASFFEDPADGFQFGSNSELDVSLDAGLVGVSIPVAEGTVIGHAGEAGGSAYFSGYIQAGNGWMPDEVPVQNTQRLLAAGLVSTDLEASYLKAEGAIRLDAGTLGDWVDLDLSDLAVAEGKLNIDKHGVLVQGRASTSLTPVIGLKGNVGMEAFFNGEPEEWYVTLDGRLEVKGVDLSANAHAVLDHEGLYVVGEFDTPLATLDMSGSITKQGVDITGSASVSIPIVAGKEVLQIVTDAAICGTEYVADAALCGTEIITDSALCGTEYVTDAAVCGFTPVKDATLCGTTWITDGAACGTRWVTDATACGWQHFSGWGACAAECIGSIFSDCDCWKPASCDVANTCEIANTCNIDATCEIAASCEVAATCERIKTCENKVTIPEFDYGTFDGSVTVQIGNSGLGGSVSGEYCATGSSCVPLGGGRMKLTSGKPEACVTVPALGEFCAPF